MDDTLDSGSTAPLPKRSRIGLSRETHAYPRKRALKACNTCRLRKTKCNNERPICGFCQTLGAVCVYDDAKDISPLDIGSQRLLDRLDLVLRKLDSNEQQSYQHLSRILARLDQVQVQDSRPDVRGVPLALQSVGDQASSELLDDHLHTDENMMTPDGRTSPDAVLDWPIFENQYPSGFITDALFIQEYSSLTSTSMSNERSSLSINEESVPRLVEIFLCRVHTKNPILDVETARRYAKGVAQDGLRWNGPSCLTLIMCALGCIARPFSDLYNQTLGQDEHISSKTLHAASLDMGRAYYEAACKRIGLLEGSILSSQCIFLCGVFEMYNMNPLKAWRWFANSSSMLYTYLRCQHVYKVADESVASNLITQRLEASIYWSSYKSMCELRTELPMPASLLAEVKYPHLLPTPPACLQSVASVDSLSSPLFVDTPESFSVQEIEISSDKMQEQAWFFYLTDIILSRLGTRVLLNLYDTPHDGWNPKYVHRLAKATEEFERQLSDWFDTLPAPIRFDDFDIRPSNELQFIVQFRALEIKAWLYRPFLYYAIHHGPYTSLSAQLQAFVIKAVDIDIHWILLRPVRHRHHGSWYVGRLVLSSALSLLAGVKGGLASEVEKLSEWRDIIKEAISTMEFWEDQSPDFGKGGDVLRAFYDELDSEELTTD